MAARYSVPLTADSALAAATAKTILNVINAANSLFRISELSVSFDGQTAGNEPVAVELCKSTQATAGTPGSSPTPVQVGGPTRTGQSTAGVNYSAEPTVLSVAKTWLVHPQTNFTLQSPLGREVEQVTSSNALAIRCNAPQAVNARGYIEFEEG